MPATHQLCWWERGEGLTTFSAARFTLFPRGFAPRAGRILVDRIESKVKINIMSAKGRREISGPFVLRMVLLELCRVPQTSFLRLGVSFRMRPGGFATQLCKKGPGVPLLPAPILLAALAYLRFEAKVRRFPPTDRARTGDPISPTILNSPAMNPKTSPFPEPTGPILTHRHSPFGNSHRLASPLNFLYHA